MEKRTGQTTHNDSKYNVFKVNSLVGIRGRALMAIPVLALSACSGSRTLPENSNEDPTSHLASPSPSGIVEYVDTEANYDGLTTINPDDAGTCLDGRPRPCVTPMRRSPHFLKPGEQLLDTILNAGEDLGNGQYKIAWPHEGSAGNPGDTLTVVCRVLGDEVYGMDRSKSSNVWNAVFVAAAVSRTGRNEIGYAPERWMVMPAGLTISECTPNENPANAPIAQTPTVAGY